MNRTILTKSRSRLNSSTLWVVVLLIVVVVTGLAWTLAQNGRTVIIADEAEAHSERVVAVQRAVELRAADAFSAELDLLRRQAAMVAHHDAATVYALSLESLAQAGRQAYIDNRLPATANGYAIYLDDLRRQGQAVQEAGSAAGDPNSFSERLDELRRMGR